MISGAHCPVPTDHCFLAARFKLSVLRFGSASKGIVYHRFSNSVKDFSHGSASLSIGSLIVGSWTSCLLRRHSRLLPGCFQPAPMPGTERHHRDPMGCMPICLSVCFAILLCTHRAVPKRMLPQFFSDGQQMRLDILPFAETLQIVLLLLCREKPQPKRKQ